MAIPCVRLNQIQEDLVPLRPRAGLSKQNFLKAASAGIQSLVFKICSRMFYMQTVATGAGILELYRDCVSEFL